MAPIHPQKHRLIYFKADTPAMPECNLDAKGKAARFVGGIASLLGAVVLGILLLTGTLELSFGWYAVGGAVFGGAFALYEARSGWCVVRALGIKTPL